MKIFVSQSLSKVGNIEYNFQKILYYYNKAKNSGADLCIFPELMLSGYTCEDLFLKKSFIKKIQHYINKLVEYTSDTALGITTPYPQEGKLYNSLIIAKNKSIIGITSKKQLPNYGIFDEKRYFSESIPKIIQINGYKIGFPICEDLWSEEIVVNLAKQGANFIIAPNASPYEKDKSLQRYSIVEQLFYKINIPIIYLNLFAVEDGIIFDGGSFIYNGSLKNICGIFKEDAALLQYNKSTLKNIHDTITNQKFCYEEEIYSALVTGLRNYLADNSFSTVVLGLSGGVDSALVASIATDAIGKANVQLVMMPYKYTSDLSISDAKATAQMLGINLKIINIEKIISAFLSTIENLNNISYQNLQARVRGNILMSIANNANALLLTTGNKSELLCGYATLYGDMAGGFNPIKDIYKSQIFDLARYRNATTPSLIKILNHQHPVMPESVISKAPSAELAPMQKDSDSIPEYSVLDSILYHYVEEDLGLDEILKIGYESETVKKIVNLVNKYEYKRKQSAPGIKISMRNLEKERRYPITNGYKEYK